jgi:hypothetical protein
VKIQVKGVRFNEADKISEETVAVSGEVTLQVNRALHALKFSVTASKPYYTPTPSATPSPAPLLIIRTEKWLPSFQPDENLQTMIMLAGISLDQKKIKEKIRIAYYRQVAETGYLGKIKKLCPGLPLAFKFSSSHRMHNWKLLFSDKHLGFPIAACIYLRHEQHGLVIRNSALSGSVSTPEEAALLLQGYVKSQKQEISVAAAAGDREQIFQKLKDHLGSQAYISRSPETDEITLYGSGSRLRVCLSGGQIKVTEARFDCTLEQLKKLTKMMGLLELDKSKEKEI